MPMRQPNGICTPAPSPASISDVAASAATVRRLRPKVTVPPAPAGAALVTAKRSKCSRPLTPAEFSTPGSSIAVIPEGFEDNDDALAKATTTLIKFRPGEIKAPTRMNWTIDNIVAYSKICTHLGCPAALYEQTTHHILCPCHQSTFDASHGASVIFGPAPRPLPQLPLMVDTDGYIAAASDFTQPVGPSFWERG